MKKPLVGLVLCAMAFQLISCEKEEVTTLPENKAQPENIPSKEGPYTLSAVDSEQIPKITDFLSTRAGKNLFLEGDATRKEGEEAIEIDEEVLQTVDTLGQTNYSFRFTKPEDPENIFYNVVAGVDSLGMQQEPQVFQYICEPDYFAEFEESGFDPTYFVGTVNLFTFDAVFGEEAASKSTCMEHDQYGDPIPCVRTHLTNGGSSGGSGGSYGGTPSNGGFAAPTLASYSLTATVYHVVPDGRTFVFGSGSVCQHPGECQVIFQVGNKQDRKALDRDCAKCPGARGGIAANTGSRTKHLVNLMKSRLSLSSSQQSFLLKNSSLVEQLNRYLARKNWNSNAKNFTKWILDFEMLPEVPCGIGHDCIKSIKVMAEGLRKFHGEEGKMMADYFDSLITDFNSFTKAELQDFYTVAQKVTEDYNNRAFDSITGAFVAGVTPILEIALLELGTTVAVKLLQKIPISWVYRGKLLDDVVKQVGLLGKKGFNNSTREFALNSPVTKAKELFNSLTKHAISKTTEANGAITANMGNGKFITFRPISASQSKTPATITLDFKNIWSQPRNVKFLYP
ncbi:hypothetical protein [Flagellimonas meishanensis]|uniref:hypothetical protein n=1 Tax=Flagellimonas meishanensis TaxID=2873264 RepID=UPI001CA72894|nr:hypothetical protein [[Muricauda] meishanensis]